MGIILVLSNVLPNCLTCLKFILQNNKACTQGESGLCSFQVHNTRFEDKGNVDVLLAGGSNVVFQDCQFLSHTALLFTSKTTSSNKLKNPGIVPQVRMANCFVSQTSILQSHNFVWALDSTDNVLFRTRNITIFANSIHYKSFDDYYWDNKIVAMESCYASGMMLH